MYLFNCGLTDAKGMHHPTVIALQLGRGLLRNTAVGSAWHHGHEWVRANLPAIIRTLMRAEHPFDVRREMQLPPECDETVDCTLVHGPNWKEDFGQLGEMTHACPRLRHKDTAFARDLAERSFFKGMTDGDRPMLAGVGDGLGEGKARQNRAATVVTNDACSFHKGKTIKQMVKEFVKKAQVLRKVDAILWDRTHALGYRLDTKGCVYQREFGDLLDDVMQHDMQSVQLLTWGFVLEKCRLMGLDGDDIEHLDYHHHPVHGKQGHHGRSSQTHELADDADDLDANSPRHPLETTLEGERRGQQKGEAPSANNVEARINLRLKTWLQHSRHMGDLVGLIIEEASRVGTECAGKHQYSTLPDCFGQCPSTTSVKQTGRHGKVKTSRDFRTMFQRAMTIAIEYRDPQSTTGMRVKFHRVQAENSVVTVEYVVASDETLRVAKKLMARNLEKPPKGRNSNFLTLESTVAVLRDTWCTYIANPVAFVEDLQEDVADWNVAQARDHMMDDNAFTAKSKHGVWRTKPTASQIHVLVEAELEFNNQAFHRLIPRIALTSDEASPHLKEAWRKELKSMPDPWRTDVGFYECLHCHQYSKTQYCAHVAAVTLIEGILPGVPGCMQESGVGTIFLRSLLPEKKNKYGGDEPWYSPMKMPWSAQERFRKQKAQNAARNAAAAQDKAR